MQTTKKLNASFIAFSPLGRSLLTDNPHTFNTAQKYTILQNNPRFIEPNLSENLKLNHKFRQLANEISTSSASLAIAWLLNKSNHIIPIPGTRSVKHLTELVKGTELKISKDILNEIDRILPVGWAHGDRYSEEQWVGPEKYC